MVKLIKIEQNACSWQQAIEKGAALLIENGYVDQSLPERIIKSTIKNGPYYILCPKLALAHAEIGDHIYKTGISLVVFKQPIAFSQSPDHNVNLLFTLVTTSTTDHMDKIKAFAELFGNEAFIDKIININDVDKIAKLLKDII